MNASHARLQGDVPILNRLSQRLPFGLQRMFSQAKFIMGNDNPYVRFFGMVAANTRTVMTDATGNLVTQSRTFLEEGITVVNAHLSTVLVARRNGYTRFVLGRGTHDPITFTDGIRAMVTNVARKREFDRRVIAVLRGGNDADQAVTETAQAIRTVLDDMHQRAQALNVPGLQHLEANYFPRLWRWDVIRDIAARPNGRQDLINLFQRALQTAGTPANPLRRFRHADGTLEDFDDVAQAAIVFADRVIGIANRADGAPLSAYDQEVAEAMGQLLGPMATPPRDVRSHRARGRMYFDETAAVNGAQDYFNRGNTNLTLDDLTDLDLASVMKKYMVSAQGEINEHRMVTALNQFLVDNRIYRPFTGRNAATPRFVQIERLSEWLDVANDMGTQMGLQPASQSTQNAMRTMIGAIRFEPVQHANNELRILNDIGQDVASIILPLVYLAKGGMFAFSAVSEISRVISTAGLTQVLAQAPTLGELVRNWRNMDEGAMNFSMLVDQAFHPSTDRLRRTLYQDLPGEQVHGGVGATTRVGRVRRAVRGALDRTATTFSDITLLAPITSFSQQLMATSMLQHLYDVSRNATRRMDDVTIRTLGLDPAQYDQIVAFVGNNADTAPFMGFDRVVNLRQLAGVEFDMLRSFIDRGVRTRIQDVPTRGDFHDAAFSFMGKIFTQFRTFSLKSVDNFMYQNASRIHLGDARSRLQTVNEVLAAVTVGAMINYSRQVMAYNDAKQNRDRKRMKEIEGRMGVEGFIKGGMSSAGEFFLPGLLADTAMETVVDPVATGFGAKDTFLNRPLFSPYEFSQSSLFGTPAMSWFRSVGKIATDAMKQDFDEGTIKHMRLISPGQNYPLMSEMYDVTQKNIVDAFRLKPER